MPGDFALDRTLAHAGGCPKCFNVFPPLREAAVAYFERGHITCSKCSAEADLWDVVLKRVLVQPPTPMHLVNLGATETHFMRDFEADKYHEIDLSTVGIPKDATVLKRGYTPQGGGVAGVVFPIELHGNVPEGRVVENVLRLLGRPMRLGDGTVGTVCPVSIWVVWVHDEKEDGWPYLIDAFEAFADRHYDRVIVPAQSAVEISLMPVVRQLLRRHASGENVDALVGDRLTFGHAVNVILPFLCGQADVPKLPDKIRGSLNSLRDLRNRIVHRGVDDDGITAQQAAEGLSAATFGFEYLRWARPQLLARLK